MGVNYVKKFLIENNNPLGANYAFHHFVYPPAIYYKGSQERTYVAYLNANSSLFSILIQYYDHVTKTWSSPYTLATGLERDGHMAASIGILPNKKLIVFYGAHYGGGQPHIKYRISTNPEDITSWESEQFLNEVTLGWSYPQPCSFSDKIVLFARDSVSDNQTRWMRNTTVDGVTWTGWTEIVNFGSGYGPYFLFNKIGDRILAAGSRCNLPTPTESINLYFAYSEDKGVTWKNANGTAITLPIDEDQKIADTLHATGNSSAILDEDGRPVVFAYLHTTEWRLQQCQYIGPLGYPCTWVLSNVRQADNTEINPVDISVIPLLKAGTIAFPLGLLSEGRPRLWRRITGYNFRYFDYYYDSGSPVVTRTHCQAVRDCHLAADAIEFFTLESPGNEDCSLYMRTYERKAEDLPRKFDGTFILDGYEDHNKIIKYLEDLEEKI
jgi:hypothetical protein